MTLEADDTVRLFETQEMAEARESLRGPVAVDGFILGEDYEVGELLGSGASSFI